MKRLFLIISALSIVLQTNVAQIKVASNNNVGIGVDNPASKLSIGNSGSTDYKVYIENQTTTGSPCALRANQFAPNTTSNAYGAMATISVSTTGYKHIGFLSQAYAGSSQTTGRTYGLYTAAGNATSGFNYGVYSYIMQQSGQTNYGAAIYAMIPSKAADIQLPGHYAGYFRGQVFIEDSLKVNLIIRCQALYQNSDESLKRNVATLAAGNMDKLKQLRGVTYNLISAEDLRQSKLVNINDTAKTSGQNINLEEKVDNKTHIGFLAQELQKVFPQLVTNDQDGVLSVDYTSLIPVLVEALKEQQATIEDLKNDIILLKNKVNPVTTTMTQTDTAIVK